MGSNLKYLEQQKATDLLYKLQYTGLYEGTTMSYLCLNAKFVFKGIIGCHQLMKTCDNSKLLQPHLEIERKLKTINFYDKHGLSTFPQQ